MRMWGNCQINLSTNIYLHVVEIAVFKTTLGFTIIPGNKITYNEEQRPIHID
jgi:hypothetical protein